MQKSRDCASVSHGVGHQAQVPHCILRKGHLSWCWVSVASATAISAQPLSSSSEEVGRRAGPSGRVSQPEQKVAVIYRSGRFAKPCKHGFLFACSFDPPLLDSEMVCRHRPWQRCVPAIQATKECGTILTCVGILFPPLL